MTTLVKSGGRSIALLDEAQREAVLAYCKVAEASGALLSLEDLIELLGIDATEEELERSISSDESLASRVSIESRRVVLKRPASGTGSSREAAVEEDRRRDRAIANIEAARAFSPLLGRGTVFVGVGGTNSYLSAAADDDIDFYCITKTDGMWAFMLKALILARIYGLFRKSIQPFCFSFVMDEKRAKEELSRPKGALYARDTLTTKVISGGAAFGEILEGASWMRGHFPTFYERRMRELRSSGGPNSTTRKGSMVVNLWLFVTLGSYVALRAWILNRKLAKKGSLHAIFKAWIEPGRLEYASRRYLELGKIYQALEKR